MFSAYGTAVTVLEALPKVLPLEDDEVSAQLARLFTRRGVTIRTGVRVKAVAAGNDWRRRRGGSGRQVGDAARRPGADGGGARRANEGHRARGLGVAVEKGFVTVSPTMETSVRGIYAVGDMTGRQLLAHKAMAEGVVAAEAIAGRQPRPVDYGNVPSCTYCRPQVASIGQSEAARRRAAARSRSAASRSPRTARPSRSARPKASSRSSPTRRRARSSASTSSAPRRPRSSTSSRSAARSRRRSRRSSTPSTRTRRCPRPRSRRRWRRSARRSTSDGLPTRRGTAGHEGPRARAGRRRLPRPRRAVGQRRGVPVGQREGSGAGRIHGPHDPEGLRRRRRIAARRAAGRRGDRARVRGDGAHRRRGQRGGGRRARRVRHRGAEAPVPAVGARGRQAGDRDHRAGGGLGRHGPRHARRRGARGVDAVRREAVDHRRGRVAPAPRLLPDERHARAPRASAAFSSSATRPAFASASATGRWACAAFRRGGSTSSSAASRRTRCSSARRMASSG